VGRDQDWASHALEHELSALYDCAHGAGLAVVFPAWMEYNMEHDVMRFAQLANRVWGCSMDFQYPEITAKAGICAFRNFLRSIGMPQTISELGGKEEDISYLAHTAAYGNGNDGTLGNFVVLKKKDMGNVTGTEFLSKIFYITDGVMLTQIREISGIDGSTLQNWTKRGWVENSKLKKYNIDQVAHILIINMLRSCIQLDKIAFLIRYVNGSVDDRSDDIIRYSTLYDYICRVLDKLTSEEGLEHDISNLRTYVKEVTAEYEEKVTGARKRLTNALEIIVVAYYSAIMKRYSEEKLEALMTN
jgi:hypothetical protein